MVGVDLRVLGGNEDRRRGTSAFDPADFAVIAAWAISRSIYNPIKRLHDVTTTYLAWSNGTRELVVPTIDTGVAFNFFPADHHALTWAVDLGWGFEGRKLGTFGYASNFSFYYAHHLSTIEGGMVCTDDEDFYETVRMLRSWKSSRSRRAHSASWFSSTADRSRTVPVRCG